MHHRVSAHGGSGSTAPAGVIERARACRDEHPWRQPVVELSVLVALFVIYTVVRSLPDASAATAIEHSRRLLSFEGPVFAHLELPLNRWLEATPVIAVAACYYYAALHYLVTPAVVLIMRHRGGWPYWRGYSTLVLTSALALAGYALFPAAPPRLVPDIGITDVLRSFAGYGWWGSAASAPRGIGDATNQFAAMPSMHFGWALWCSIQMWQFGSRGWRALAIAYPSILFVVVLGTGNHYLVDVLAGAACVGIAYATVTVVKRWMGHRAKPGGSTRDRDSNHTAGAPIDLVNAGPVGPVS